MCGDTGTCTVATTSTTVSTEKLAGHGVDTGVLVCICTATALSGATTRASGAEFEHIGISGSVITTTVQIGGFGARAVASTVTGIGCELSCVGMVFDGCESGVIGVATAKITTTTSSMAVIDGFGEDTGASVCIVTVCAFCSAISRVSGVWFASTGVFGRKTITIKDLAGAGAVTSALVTTGTDCASFTTGQEPAGGESRASPTGTYIAATIIATASMDVLVPFGVDTGVLVSTSTDGAFFSVIVTESGAVFVQRGAFGVATTTIAQIDGSGVARKGLDTTCIV